jgi:hypothetical protein
LPKWTITQQDHKDHKVHKDGLFEQKLAKVAKLTDPDMASEIGINSGFGGDFSCITQFVAPPSFAYFANFCSKDLSLHPCCTRRNWGNSPFKDLTPVEIIVPI